MAYMSQERKAQLAPAIKAACTKYGIKATIAVRNHSTLVVNIKQGKIDFIGNSNEVCGRHPRYNDRPMQPSKDYIDVNPYWYHEHFDGVAKAFLTELFTACNNGNHDNSDAMTDYFDVGWYVDVNIGSWNKPYALTNV
jgi:hypothetical protein